jgi:uncharacterized protein YcnI
MSTALSRLGQAVPVGLLVVVLAAGAAAAHVEISPRRVPAGGSAELTLRVPNEESAAATTQVTVRIPTAHPIAQVLAKPVPGWTVTEHRVRLARPLVTDDGRTTSVVSQVAWSGGRIGPGEYQDFSISVDPLPDRPGPLAFKTLQTYSNGDVVRWIDLPQPGQGEPAHPAPLLVVTGSGASHDVAPATAGSGWPGVLAVVAAVLAVAAAGAAGLALLRTRHGNR